MPRTYALGSYSCSGNYTYIVYTGIRNGNGNGWNMEWGMGVRTGNENLEFLVVRVTDIIMHL